MELTFGEKIRLLREEKELNQTELGREVQEHLLQNRGVIIHHRVLRQEADLYIGISGNRSGISLRDACQNLQKGGFSGSVDTNDTGLVSLIPYKYRHVS